MVAAEVSIGRLAEVSLFKVGGAPTNMYIYTLPNFVSLELQSLNLH